MRCIVWPPRWNDIANLHKGKYRSKLLPHHFYRYIYNKTLLMSMPANVSAKSPSLSRVLGLTTAILLVSGMMIGSGVFKKIVPMAQSGLSQGGILLAWTIAGIITMLGAFTMAGLSSLTEESGGMYEYLRLAFGNFFSFLFGWTDFAVIGSASIAAVAFIFAQTINTFIALPNPLQAWEHIAIANIIFPFADSGIKLVAIAAIMLLTWVNCRGVQNGGMINNIITSAKIGGIIILIVFGLLYTAPVADMPVTTPAPEKLNSSLFLSAIFGAMLNAFWAYDGWANISFISGEIKNPRKNIPLAIITGVSIAMTVYLLINFVYMHVLPLQQLAAVDRNTIGAAVVAEKLLGHSGQTVIVALIMVSVFGTLNGLIMSHSRVYFRMAQEKYFFTNAASVHPKYKTPHISLLYTMAWSCVLVISGTFDMLTDMVIFTAFLFFGLMAVALIKLKRNGTITAKVTGYPLVPVVFILFTAALLVNTFISAPGQTIIGILLTLSGVLFYYYFKQKGSKED